MPPWEMELLDAGVTYPGAVPVRALRPVSLRFAAGEMVAVAGRSGSGKSTLLNVLGLLDRPTQGRYLVRGVDTSELGESAMTSLRAREFGFVFQTFHLIADLPVVDNVEIPLLYRKVSGRERRRRALAALERVGLSSRVHHTPSQLSGGQQQRVAIARAIVGGPKVLLADEPTGNLDSAMGDDVMGLLCELNERDGTTVVMVTHDAQKAALTHRTIRFFDGRAVN
jgi:putative ABC transport system ATP-binding protein